MTKKRAILLDLVLFNRADKYVNNKKSIYEERFRIIISVLWKLHIRNWIKNEKLWKPRTFFLYLISVLTADIHIHWLIVTTWNLSDILYMHRYVLYSHFLDSGKTKGNWAHPHNNYRICISLNFLNCILM